MCGIAGFFSPQQVAPQIPGRMLDVLRRRGPDAQHSVLWNDRFERTQGAACNALLHARLSIIDPRPQADQPMSNDAGDVWICYNGEVYDWAAAAAELKALGYTFRNRSDTEFILHAYEAWGIDCIARLRGMFAFTILDLKRRTAWLVRDRMGLKPLVYASFDGRLAFGSTVRSVLPFLPETQSADSAAESAADAVGPDYASPLAARYFAWRKTTIYGGSNEIQRNIIAQAVLGL